MCKRLVNASLISAMVGSFFLLLRLLVQDGTRDRSPKTPRQSKGRGSPGASDRPSLLTSRNGHHTTAKKYNHITVKRRVLALDTSEDGLTRRKRTQ